MIIKILLFPVILLLVLYFVIGLVVPTSRTITTEKQIILQKESSLAVANTKINSVNLFIQAVASHAKEKEFVMDFVPNDRREEIILNDLSQLAAKSGVSLFSVGFSDGQKSSSAAAKDQRIQPMSTDIVASGTYESFKKFSYELFRMKRLYSFRNFELVKVEKDEKQESDSQEQMLSGTLSFVYGYIPGNAQVNPSTFTQEADFTFVDKVMNAAIDTNSLVSQSTNRSNPFLP